VINMAAKAALIGGSAIKRKSVGEKAKKKKKKVMA